MDVLVRSDGFWDRMQADHPEFGSGWVSSISSFSPGPWPNWERHPLGDELLMLLEGRLAVLFEEERSELAPGQICVVPQNTWHSADVAETSRLLFFTPSPIHTEDKIRTSDSPPIE